MDASVFEQGALSVEVVKRVNASLAKPLCMVYPKTEGKYPVLLFFHAFIARNTHYCSLFQHIASHGFIVVAPCCGLPTDDIKAAAAAARWLATSKNLKSTLPEAVEPDLDKLSLAGHSRGGHIAFSLLAQKRCTAANFKVLLGIDPVMPCNAFAGRRQGESFDLNVPVLVVGAGAEPSCCAPGGRNHWEFYNRCNSPRCHVIFKDCGHMDMLDDSAWLYWAAKCLCNGGKGMLAFECERALMRRRIGGVMVAYLNDCLRPRLLLQEVPFAGGRERKAQERLQVPARCCRLGLNQKVRCSYKGICFGAPPSIPCCSIVSYLSGWSGRPLLTRACHGLGLAGFRYSM